MFAFCLTAYFAQNAGNPGNSMTSSTDISISSDVIESRPSFHNRSRFLAKMPVSVCKLSNVGIFLRYSFY